MSLPLPSPPSKVQGPSELCPGSEREQSAPALPPRLRLPCDPWATCIGGGTAHMCLPETLAPSDAATRHRPLHSSSVARPLDPTEPPPLSGSLEQVFHIYWECSQITIYIVGSWRQPKRYLKRASQAVSNLDDFNCECWQLLLDVWQIKCGFPWNGSYDRISISQGSCIFYINTIFIIGAIADKSKCHKYICQPVNLWAKIPMLPSRSRQPHMYHI